MSGLNAVGLPPHRAAVLLPGMVARESRSSRPRPRAWLGHHLAIGGQCGGTMADETLFEEDFPTWLVPENIGVRYDEAIFKYAPDHLQQRLKAAEEDCARCSIWANKASEIILQDEIEAFKNSARKWQSFERSSQLRAWSEWNETISFIETDLYFDSLLMSGFLRLFARPKIDLRPKWIPPLASFKVKQDPEDKWKIFCNESVYWNPRVVERDLILQMAQERESGGKTNKSQSKSSIQSQKEKRYEFIRAKYKQCNEERKKDALTLPKNPLKTAYFSFEKICDMLRHYMQVDCKQYSNDTIKRALGTSVQDP
jgi:hypothetical protein